MHTTKRILLVDDDSDDRELFCEALGIVGPLIICDCAKDSTEAFKILDSRRIDLPEIIFMDINLPVISGWQCLNMLKNTEAFQHIPVIIYSTSSHERDREIAKELGASTFFTKPYYFEELKKMLQDIISHLEKDSISALGSGTLS